MGHFRQHLLGENLSDVQQEEGAGGENGEDIRHGLRIVNAHNAEKPRQNQGEGDQKDHLTKKGDAEGDLSPGQVPGKSSGHRSGRQKRTCLRCRRAGLFSPGR